MSRQVLIPLREYFTREGGDLEPLRDAAEGQHLQRHFVAASMAILGHHRACNREGADQGGHGCYLAISRAAAGNHQGE